MLYFIPTWLTKLPGPCGKQPRLKPNPRGPFWREQCRGLHEPSTSFCGDCSAAEADKLLSFSLSTAPSSLKRRGDRPNCKIKQRNGEHWSLSGFYSAMVSNHCECIHLGKDTYPGSPPGCKTPAPGEWWWWGWPVVHSASPCLQSPHASVTPLTLHWPPAASLHPACPPAQLDCHCPSHAAHELLLNKYADIYLNDLSREGPCLTIAPPFSSLLHVRPDGAFSSWRRKPYPSGPDTRCSFLAL